MSQAMPELNLDGLSTDQRIDLIAQIWDSFPDSGAELPMPQWHRQELERRLKSANELPAQAIPWEQVKKELRGTE